MSTDNPYGPDQLQPQIPRPSGNSSAMMIGIIVAVAAIPMFLVCAGIVVALALPAVQAAREAARRTQCQNNLKQIALAMHNYQAQHGSFPPAYTVDAAGQPLHSWRTLLLPYIGQQALYNQIDLSKPWDDPANAAMNDINIPIYACPSIPIAPGATTYVVVDDPSGIFSGSQPCNIQQVVDGTSNTVLVVETEQGNAVSWMSPQDINANVYLNPSPSAGPHPGGASVAMADGSVRFLSNNAGVQTRSAMLTKGGNEAIQIP